uniref:hypothetical protein n=1 Tax=Phormidesmis priestleyi TaxID=268141 RepID=UPI001E35D463
MPLLTWSTDTALLGITLTLKPHADFRGKRGIRTKSYAKPKSLFLYDLQDFIIYLSGVLIRLILPSRPKRKVSHTGYRK